MRIAKSVLVLPIVALIALTLTPAQGYAAPSAPHQEQWWIAGYDLVDGVWPHATGRGITVAVLDTGVNAALPEFAGTIVPGADFDTGQTNGTVDTAEGPGGGTGAASLIASRGGPHSWVGVAPDAQIMPIVVGPNSEDMVNAIRYATDQGAKVIDISYGFPSTATDPNSCPPELQAAVNYALNHEVVLVAAAGESGDTINLVQYPAGCPGVVAVGAIDGNALTPWQQTQRQDYVAISAPGGQVGYIGKDGNLYHYAAGSRLAAALASGVVALVRSAHPEMSAREVVQRILNTTKDVGPAFWDNQTGEGLALPKAAITENVPANAPNRVYERWDEAVGNGGTDATDAPAEDQPSSSGGRQEQPADAGRDQDNSRAANSSNDGDGLPPILWALIASGSVLLLGGIPLVVVHRRTANANRPLQPPMGYPSTGFGGPTSPPPVYPTTKSSHVSGNAPPSYPSSPFDG